MTYPEAKGYDPNLREAMADRAEASTVPWVCIYCGREWPQEVDRHDLTSHLWECPKHPLSAAGDLIRRYLGAMRPFNRQLLAEIDSDAYDFLMNHSQLPPSLPEKDGRE